MTVNYGAKEECQTVGEECSVEFEVRSEMTHPIYVYYELENFYQNHRRYVQSLSPDQLKGNYLSVDELKDCSPVKRNKDLGEKVVSVSGKILKPEDPAIPCGLVAKSFFNDTFKLRNTYNGEKIPIN